MRGVTGQAPWSQPLSTPPTARRTPPFGPGHSRELPTPSRTAPHRRHTLPRALMVQETTEEARAGVFSEEALTTITHVGPLPDIEVVEFGEEGEESVPLRELGSMLLGRMQTEEAQEPELLAEPSLDEESLLSPGARATIPSHSLRQNVIGGIKDIFLVTKLAARLWTYVAKGWMWLLNFWRLVLFATILFPGFAQMIVFYFFSPRLLRSIAFGSKPRNRLDVFVPRRRWQRQGPLPTVIFITGGAWTIGYKAWGALLGRRLSQRGVLVFCLDYRNFPQGTALDMLQDVNTGISWVINNVALYGGDPTNLFVVGQSAGGHLGSLALLAQARHAARADLAAEGAGDRGRGDVGEREPASSGKGGAAGIAQPGSKGATTSSAVLPEVEIGGTPRWDVDRVKGFVGVSGAYDLEALAAHLDGRGLNRDMFGSIMSLHGTPALRALSPTHVAAGLAPGVACHLPPVLLLHGTADRSVPVDNALGYAAALESAGARVRLKLYRGKTHTQPIVEDPMRGGRDELMDDVLELVAGKAQTSRQFPMLPSFLIDLATAVCPF
ncbi:hypothetical protein ACKKBG_A03820 [Auxenochlorella protothecoides x Auxenochlorella symbiontica]